VISKKLPFDQLQLLEKLELKRVKGRGRKRDIEIKKGMSREEGRIMNIIKVYLPFEITHSNGNSKAASRRASSERVLG